MPRKPKAKSQAEAPREFDEFVDDGESIDDDGVNLDAASLAAQGKSRDWRDVERYREERELRKRVGDDFDDLLDDRPRHRR